MLSIYAVNASSAVCLCPVTAWHGVGVYFKLCPSPSGQMVCVEAPLVSTNGVSEMFGAHHT
jgi:hypothetical protein